MNNLEYVIQEIDDDSITFRGGSTVKLKKLLGVNPDNLVAEYAEQASWYGYIASRQADAEYLLSIVSAMKDQCYAKLDAIYRKDSERQGKKFTETSIKGMVQQDQEYIDLGDATAELAYHVNVLKGLTQAMKQRAEMLVAMGLNMRTEAQMTGMVIRDQSERNIEEARSRLRKHDR